MNIEFGGKTVLVTGAAHGFGRAIALAFLANGAKVFACDVNTAGNGRPKFPLSHCFS